MVLMCFFVYWMCLGVQDQLTTSDEETFPEVRSGGSNHLLPAVPQSETSHLGLQQVSSWETSVVPTLPNGEALSVDSMHDIEGTSDAFTVGAEAILEKILADTPKPAHSQVTVSVALPQMPANVQPVAAPSVAPAKTPGTLSWRSIVTGTQEVSAGLLGTPFVN